LAQQLHLLLRVFLIPHLFRDGEKLVLQFGKCLVGHELLYTPTMNARLHIRFPHHLVILGCMLGFISVANPQKP
jgi:hypothetical protein